MALLELQDVVATYGSRRALHGVSMNVEEGSIVAMLGANGAGKTTTLRAITGLVKVQGAIRFDGQRITGRSTEEIARLGIAHVPEGRGTMTQLSVLENLHMGACLRRDGRAVRQDLDRVYAYFPWMKTRVAQPAALLSGGEQQMLAIARAVMMRPRLLLLDEPSLGLAPIVVGGIYASLALALVLIYRAMEAINFAQGEMATFSTFVAWTLMANFHMSFWIAFPLVVVLSFVGGVALERVVIRPVERAPILTTILVTLGLFAIFNGLSGLIWGYTIRTFPSPFPVTPITLGGVGIGFQDLGLIAVSLVLLFLIYLFFSRTKLGLMMRAASLYPQSSRLVGVRVGWMLALGWGLSAAVGAVSGMMVAPVLSLDPNLMQSVLLFAFTAAVLGGIENPLGAMIGGIVVGVLLALVGTYIPHAEDLRLVFGFIVIVLVLLFRPAGLIGRAHVTRV